MMLRLVPLNPEFTFGIAKLLREDRSSTVSSILAALDAVPMKAVCCEVCCARFALFHKADLQDAGLAQKQALWLKAQLLSDHVHEKTTHASTIPLPGIKQVTTFCSGEHML